MICTRVILLDLVPSAVLGGSHAILLDTTEHVPRVIEIVRSEGEAIEVGLMVNRAYATLTYIRISGWRVTRVCLLLLLIFQVALHELSNCS